MRREQEQPSTEREDAVWRSESTLGSMQDTQSEEVKFRPTRPLSFQAFEPIDLAFDLPLIPSQGTRGSNGRVILQHALGEPVKFGDMADLSCINPCVQI